MKKTALYEVKIALESQREMCVLNFTSRPTATEVVSALKTLQIEAASRPDPDDDDQDGYLAEMAAFQVAKFHSFMEVAERMQSVDEDTGNQCIKVAGTTIGRIQHRTIEAWER